MNEHGIVTWVVLGGKGSNKKGRCLISKGRGRKMPKKVFEPLKLKNRTESKVSIGFFSIHFQSEAQCFNIQKKTKKHILESLLKSSHVHIHTFHGRALEGPSPEENPKVEINPAKPTSINTANPKKEHLPHTDDAYTDSPAALLGWIKNGWMMIFFCRFCFVGVFCCWCFCC